MVEESIYTMMAKFKNTPLELDNTMPKELYSIVENKWHYCQNMEKEIRESNLAHVMPELTKGQITRSLGASLHPNIEPSTFFKITLKM